jgi:hypothetical protein
MNIEIGMTYLMLTGPTNSVTEVKVMKFSPSRAYVEVAHRGSGGFWVPAHAGNFVECLESTSTGEPSV